MSEHDRRKGERRYDPHDVDDPHLTYVPARRGDRREGGERRSMSKCACAYGTPGCLMGQQHAGQPCRTVDRRAEPREPQEGHDG